MNKESFPDGFFWGAATSAYQFEGDRDGHGKKRSIVDENINSSFADTSIASDHYNHWEEDVSLMKELGMNSYRFSISWPRIISNAEGDVNTEGIIFYNNLIDELKKNDIEPIVTLYHFDLPDYLQKKYGGWQSRQIIEDFEHFCYVAFKNFGDRVKYWLTINEQSNMFALPYLLNLSNDESAEKAKFQMNHNMMLANATAINLAHRMDDKFKIGPAIGLSPFYPATSKPDDIIAARNAMTFRNNFFMDIYFFGTYNQEVLNYLNKNNILPDMGPNDQEILMSAKPDYLGINYYESRTVKFVPENFEYHAPGVSVNEGDERLGEVRPGLYAEIDNEFLPSNAWGWKLDPKGFRILLHEVYDRYNVPIMITENGIGGVEELTSKSEIHDDYRIEYLTDHLLEMKKAMDEGVEVIGYQPWAFMDLLSTTNGFKKRYGFVYVNRTDKELLDMKRIKKDSFFWYQKVISSNGEYLNK